MGIIQYLKDKSDDYLKKRREKEREYFHSIKNGLNDSMDKISDTLLYVEDWNELLNLKKETDKEKHIYQNTIKQEYKKCKNCFIVLGVIFCILHLIAIQEGIIMLNALFEEIKDEITLLATDTPRKYSFYEHLEIASYKDIPEIDVAMVSCTLGIMCLKKFGFYYADLGFQIASSLGFLVLFLIFDFHTGEELVDNYSTTEIVVLIISYILLSILVGCASTLALKEFWDLYSIFKNYEFEISICDILIVNEKVLFYLFPSIAAVLIILINGLIFYEFKKHLDIKSKWLLIAVLGIFVLFFASSIFFHICYAIPVENKKKRIENLEKEKKEKEEERRKGEEKKEKEEETKKQDEKDKIIKEVLVHQKNNDKNLLSSDSELKGFPAEKIEDNKEEPIKKRNHSYELLIKSLKDIYKKQKYEATNVCTLFGYVYFQKQIGDKNVCIIYDYAGCCSWTNQTICQIDNIIIIILLICQVCMVGHNSIIDERLLNDSFWNNFGFFICLIFFSVLIGTIYARLHFESMIKREYNYDDCRKRCGYFGFLSIFLYIFFGYSFFCAIYSLRKGKYLEELSKKKNINEESAKRVFDGMFMVELIIFKCLDLQILSLFEFYDNPDIINSALLITLEKVLWMILEPIFNLIPIKILLYIQLIISILCFCIASFSFFYSYIFNRICNKSI